MERTEVAATGFDVELVAPLLRVELALPAELDAELVAPLLRVDVASPAAFETEVDG